MTAYTEDLKNLLDRIDELSGSDSILDGGLTDSSGIFIEFIRETVGDPETALVINTIEFAK